MISYEEFENRLDKLYNICTDFEEEINRYEGLNDNHKVAFRIMSAFIKKGCKEKDKNIIYNFNRFKNGISREDNKLKKYNTLKSKISAKVDKYFDDKDEAIEYISDEYDGNLRELVNFFEELDD